MYGRDYEWRRLCMVEIMYGGYYDYVIICGVIMHSEDNVW